MNRKQKTRLIQLTKDYVNPEMGVPLKVIENITIVDCGVRVAILLPDGRMIAFYKDGCAPTMIDANDKDLVTWSGDEGLTSIDSDWVNTAKVFDEAFYPNYIK